MMINKKAQFGSAIILFYSIIIIAVIFLGFYLFVIKTNILSGGTTEIKAIAVKDLSKEYSLISFLRMPIESGGSAMDLLALEKYEEFKQEVTKAFTKTSRFHIYVNDNFVFNGGLGFVVDEDRKVCTMISVLNINEEAKNVKFCIEKK